MSYDAENDLRELLETIDKGPPLFIEVDEIVDPLTVKASLLLPAFNTPADTKVLVKQVKGHRGRDSFARHIAGDDRVSPLRKGDIVSFSGMMIGNGDAYVSSISSRTHDGMAGKVQFARALVRAGTTTVNKYGAVQYFTIVDALENFRPRSREEVVAAFKVVKARSEWGTPGFIMRDHEGNTRQYFVDKDHPVEALNDELESMGMFAPDARFLMMSAWNLRASSDQVMRDVNIKEEVSRKLGRVGSQFLAPKAKFPGFKTCGIIVCDEDEYAFGGKTGKTIRVAAGVQPVSHQELPISPREISFDARSSRKPVALAPLYKDETLMRHMEERAARSTPAQKPTQTPTPARQAPKPVSSFTAPVRRAGGPSF